MELIKFEDYIKQEVKPSLCATIGDFDGVHIAHQLLIKRTKEIANNKQMKSAVLTFEPHPLMVLKNENVSIMSLNEKKETIESFGIDYLIIINFDDYFSKLEPSYFIDNYLININIKEVVVGFDFCFGYHGSGKAEDIERLSNKKINANIISKIEIDKNKVSSTLLRKYLKEGNLFEVRKLLNRDLSFIGKVIEGRMIGRTLNLPTANLKLESNLILRRGVYAVKVIIDDIEYMGMMNVGHDPSFNYYSELSFEINIFDFDQNIYGRYLKVYCYKFIRDEVIFDNTNDFLQQVAKDKDIILNYFSK